MEATMAAIRAGDYARAYEELQRSPQAGTPFGGVCGVLLLALAERFDEADEVIRAANVPTMSAVVNGERQRAARWRDPANGSFAAAEPSPLGPLYAEMAVAFAQGDQARAERTKADLEKHARPIAGKLTFWNGKELAFSDIADADDAIGQMLETYCEEGLVYFPFEHLRRVEMLPRRHLLEHLMPMAKITTAQGTGMAYVPLLYACSATDPIDHLRTGQSTFFVYLGAARRGRGQRDFAVDRAMVGLQNIAAIDFA